MFYYILRRLLLLPITLFFIIIVNFIIINLTPGDPVTLTEISAEGPAMRKEDRALASDEPYRHFREHYGLTLPILLNFWPFFTLEKVQGKLEALLLKKPSLHNPEALTVSEYHTLQTEVGDGARYFMPHLVAIFSNPQQPFQMRQIAMRFFVRGGSLPAYVGASLTKEQKQYNKKIGLDDTRLRSFLFSSQDSSEEIYRKCQQAVQWYQENKDYYHFEPSSWQKLSLFVFETRFFRYLSRVVTLDFGTLRNDSNKTVISEVAKRFKYSLTLAIIPMLLTFFLCQLFAFIMAIKQQRWPDYLLNLIFLFLYAIPVFVVAPFLIELSMNRYFPFTETPIPISGFASPDPIYNRETSLERLLDILQHLFLPFIAIIYGSLAAQTRLSRTAILEVLRQDYVRTAWAKGVSFFDILVKHVGRNAGITIITSLAGSLGIVLGGSLIVETIFEINGFGKFFYEAVINRDYNVIMFSTLAGSFLSLLGYLLADIAYMWLDPRVTL